jgi:hypothetical protein
MLLFVKFTGSDENTCSRGQRHGLESWRYLNVY